MTGEELIEKYNQLVDENNALKEENAGLRDWFIKLTEDILKEIDKDGWCRMTISKEYVNKIREDLDLLKDEWSESNEN